MTLIMKGVENNRCKQCGEILTGIYRCNIYKDGEYKEFHKGQCKTHGAVVIDEVAKPQAVTCTPAYPKAQGQRVGLRDLWETSHFSKELFVREATNGFLSRLKDMNIPEEYADYEPLKDAPAPGCVDRAIQSSLQRWQDAQKGE